MPRPSRLTIDAPPDFDLPRVVCSYGYFLLAPNRWRPQELTLEHTLEVASGQPPVRVEVRQPSGRGGDLRVLCDRSLSRAERETVVGRVARMLRLDFDVRPWGKLAPVARRRGFGRLFRSATLWEDMVKTITSCNVGWPSTVRMNELLVERVGQGVFPSSAVVARWKPERLQRETKVGYRAARIVQLAKRFDSGELDPAWFESIERSVEEIREAVLALNGFGPYAAANVLQLLGRFDDLPIDTETYRLYCKRTGVERPSNPKALDSQIDAYYEPFRPYRFLAFWFDLWRDYEQRHGDAWTWDPDIVGRRFTASQLK
jgi:3-methyladenine DNA glycosylase/8-oxoguanine DNA glycosylase